MHGNGGRRKKEGRNGERKEGRREVTDIEEKKTTMCIYPSCLYFKGVNEINVCM